MAATPMFPLEVAMLPGEELPLATSSRATRR
jgi:Lon protease-like protein